MKKSLIFVFALITILLPLNSNCYHHLQFVQVWSPTYCAQTNLRCINPLRRDFYVHGLWPADQIGKTIPCIHPISDWNLVQSGVIEPNVDDIELQLFCAWPSIRYGFKTKSFWKRQYDKHGRCAHPHMTYLDYFGAIIEQRARMDFQKILGNSQINPSTNRAYSRDEIQNAINVVIGQGNEIYISCKPLNSTHAFLFEIYICLQGIHADIYMSCAKPSPSKGCHPHRTRANIIIPP